MTKQPKSLKYTAYQYIKEQIVSGKLPEGSFIQEGEIQKAIGSSRTPVREALLMLQSDGFVEIHPRKGISVAGITLKMINNNYQMRLIIEPGALRIVGGDLPRNVLEDYRSRFACEIDSDKWETLGQEMSDLDEAFHANLIEATNNDMLLRTMENVWAVERWIRGYMFGGEYRKLNNVILANQEHVTVIDALLAGDVELAAENMRRHILLSWQRACIQSQFPLYR